MANKKSDSPVVALGPFPKGFNNVDDENFLPEGSLRKAENVDIDRIGWVKRRAGYYLIYSGINIHSLYERYFVEDGTLKILEIGNVPADIVSGITDKPLSYCKINNTVYFSNEDNNGTVNGEWGVLSLSILPIVSASSGSLVAGKYQISFAYSNSNGEIGGATNPIVLDVPENGRIDISNIPVLSGYNTEVFVSQPNEDQLFRQYIGQDTSVSVGIYNYSGIKLQTLFMKQIIPGHIIRGFKGRIYVAEGSTLWYTEAQRYGLYKPASNYFNFPERITVVQETEAGIYVVADKIYFLSGTDPKQMTISIAGEGSNTGIEGTGISADAKNFDVGATGKIAYWFGNKGAVLGFSDGQIKYISEDRVSVASADSGCTGYREIDGIRQLITNLFQQEPENSFGASDNVTAQVIRNGTVI